jgi:hypothetical protein
VAKKGCGNNKQSLVEERLDRFFEQFGSEFANIPQSVVMGQMLARASEVNDPLVFSFLLQVFLLRYGLNPPEGVFAVNLNSRRGRPRRVEDAFRVWVSYHSRKGRNFWDVAREVFPEDFKKGQKRTADRVRQLYRSFEKLLPTLKPDTRKNQSNFLARLNQNEFSLVDSIPILIQTSRCEPISLT